jgi:FkbM family methyltransferase
MSEHSGGKNGVESVLASGGPIAIYGAGTIGRDCLRLLTRRGTRVKYVLDRKSKPGQRLEGMTVLSPDDTALSMEERARIPVIITIFNAYVYMPDVHAALQRDGWKTVIGFLDFYQTFGRELGDRYWLTQLDFYSDKASAIQSADALWADQKSRDLYRSILEFRRSGKYDLLPAPESQPYFPADLPAWKQPIRLIDCGAFDGDTLRQAADLGLAVEAVAAFEPDLGNYARLCREIGRFSGAGSSAWPAGVWSSTTQLRFDAGNGTGSAISQSGGTVIQVVAIDDALPAFAPSLIKMDIEGAEYEALIGARNVIEAYRPGLAICLYHCPAHLWQIPLLLADWGLQYTFYLRSYCFNGFELVLYAVPHTQL